MIQHILIGVMVGAVVKFTVPAMYGGVQVGKLVMIPEDMEGAGFKASGKGSFDSGERWSKVKFNSSEDCCRDS